MDYSVVRKHLDTSTSRMFDLLESKRSTFVAIAKEFLPSAIPGFTKDEKDLSEGVNEADLIAHYTCYPQMQVKKGSAGFNTNLTSPARPWFRLRPKAYGVGADELATSSAVNNAMDKATDAVGWLMTQSGCYAECNKFFKHWLTFGTAAMLVLPDEKNIARTVTLRPGTYAIDIDDDSGKVNRLSRKFSWSIASIIKFFGKANLPQSLLQRTDLSQRIVVVNLIEPNAPMLDRAWDNPSKEIDLNEKFTYRSIYFFQDSSVSPETSGIILPVRGFTYNPIVCCRYEHEHGDVWGLGVGLTALPIARGLDSYKYDLQKVSGDNAEPAVVASSELKDEGLQLGRRGVNWSQPGAQRENMVVPALPGGRDMSLTKEEAISAQQELAEAFFVSAFATIDALKLNPGVKTATEVEQLVRENLEMLGAHVSNLDDEFLDPLVTTHFRIAQDAGIAIHGDNAVASDLDLAGIEIEYVSAIHLAQKAARLKNTQQWLALVMQAASADPTLTQLPDWEASLREIQRMMGVPEKMAKSDRDYKKIREAAAAAQADAAQREMMAAGSDTAKTLAELPVDTDHLGGRIAQALGA